MLSALNNIELLALMLLVLSNFFLTKNFDASAIMNNFGGFRGP